jgi:hypothetical protein
MNFAATRHFARAWQTGAGPGGVAKAGIVAAQRYDARDVAISFFVASQLGG